MSGAPSSLVTLITIHVAGRRLEILLPKSEGESIDLVAEGDLEAGPEWSRLTLGGIPLRWRAVERGGGR